MIKDLKGEVWKPVVFDFQFTNDCRFEISNFGRVKTYNKISQAGSLLNGSMINGYRIIRLKLYEPRGEKLQQRFDFLKDQVLKLSKKLSPLKQAVKVKKRHDDKYFADKKKVEETTALIDSLKKNLSKQLAADLKKRTIHHHALIHRLVADYFLPKPSKEFTVVAHLDFDKLNNYINNLKWMTPEENYAHQQKSPNVIAEKKERVHKRKVNSKATKLTVTKVMLLKKLLNQGKPMRTLVKQFKITDTQILRIKRGENWADVEAAR